MYTSILSASNWPAQCCCARSAGLHGPPRQTAASPRSGYSWCCEWCNLSDGEPRMSRNACDCARRKRRGPSSCFRPQTSTPTTSWCQGTAACGGSKRPSHTSRTVTRQQGPSSRESTRACSRTPIWRAIVTLFLVRLFLGQIPVSGASGQAYELFRNCQLIV